MRDFKEHCKIPEMHVPTRNLFGHIGCIEEEGNKKTRKGSSRGRTGSDKVEEKLGRRDKKGTQTRKERD